MLLTTSKLIAMGAYTETGVQTVDAAESINSNYCRTFQPRKHSPTAYKINFKLICLQLTKAYVAEMPCN